MSDTSVSLRAPASTTTPAARAQRPRGRLGPRWAMIPGLVVLAALSIYPALYSIYISLFRWNLQDPTNRPFVGLRNYASLLTDASFWHALQVTAVFVVCSVALEFVLAFGLALVFFRGLPGEKLMRGLILLPMLCAPVVMGLLAKFTLDPSFGIVNQILGAVGIPHVDFLGSTSLALPTIIAIDVWQWTPFLFLIFLAGMQGLPEEVIEASKLDGASWPRIVWHQFFPLLRYPILVGLALRLIDTFRVYDVIFMTTRGGPVDATSTMSWQIYDVGFRSFNLSYAAAFSWLLLIIVLVCVSAMIRRIVNHESGA
ncbi:carbohydrate ABC transporter permease [Georgenia sp. SYP-B2076]|uniref:carbohydrate ABC transporter permease n=1 Tax=Georgenia sp. SYP-B2076 TaxID=2495881 RepID=UPI000F8CE0FD|nr:sugar ABC transporter permease [Georgenia sp. SYP-B2076]